MNTAEDMTGSALFLDRDGVINVDRGYVHRPDQFEFVPGIFPLARFWTNELHRPIVVVSNQSGIGRGYFDEKAHADLTRWMCDRFEAEGAAIARVYHCPYHPLHGIGEYRREHPWRKPNPGMILQAVFDLRLDPARCAIVGDKMSDVEAGAAAGLGLRILSHPGLAKTGGSDSHPMKWSPISAKRSHCCGPALQRLRPISALGASDSTLELAVALGHYHGAKVFAPAGVAGGNAGIGSQSRMSTSVASDLDTKRASRGGGAGKIAIFAAKLLVTGACFWYLSRQINLGQVISAVPLLDFRWAAFAVLVVMLEIPLAGLRWSAIVDALAARDERVTRTVMIGVTAIGVFFAQVLPSVAGDGVRAWLLARRGCDWRNAVISVVIDRASRRGPIGRVGICHPPAAADRPHCARRISRSRARRVRRAAARRRAWPVARAEDSAATCSLAIFSLAGQIGRGRSPCSSRAKGPEILALGCLIHALTIVVVWSVGRAQGLVLPVSDAAVLFTVMIGVALVPISISGWGLRELAVISLLGNHGIAPERALLFSVCFGLVLALGSLPGALAWLFYSFGPSWRSAERGG